MKVVAYLQIVSEIAAKRKAVHKPKFLEELEIFLEKELRALGATHIEPSNLRLQVFKTSLENISVESIIIFLKRINIYNKI